MQPPKDFNLESPKLSDISLARDQKSPKTATVQEPKPKLPEEMEKWDREWHEATAASDLANHVLSPVLRFYTAPGLPPYYKVKSLVFCSTAYKGDGDESPRDLESRRYFLEKAQAALQRCEVYIHPDDCEEVQEVKDYLDEEWLELLEAEGSAKEDDGDGQADR